MSKIRPIQPSFVLFVYKDVCGLNFKTNEEIIQFAVSYFVL
jgi:hypothetical protein